MARFYFTVYSRQYNFLGRCVGGSDCGLWPSDAPCKDFIKSMADWEGCQVHIFNDGRCAELISFTGSYSRYEIVKMNVHGEVLDELKFAKMEIPREDFKGTIPSPKMKVCLYGRETEVDNPAYWNVINSK